jgi:hypothetical protein
MVANRRRKVRQVHEVNMSMKAWDLAKAGAAVTIKVKRQKRLLGTIQIGQGSFRWQKAGGKSGFKRIRWGKLADKLNEMT